MNFLKLDLSSELFLWLENKPCFPFHHLNLFQIPSSNKESQQGKITNAISCHLSMAISLQSVSEMHT